MSLERSDGGRRDGFALVAVLVVTGLLAGLLATMSLWARSSVEAAAISTLDVEIDALLQGGVAIAGFELFEKQVPKNTVDGQQIALDAGTVTISVLDDGDKIDLNGANAVLLAIAYRAAGLRAVPPETFAARVVDWRDPDARLGKNGAEEGEYRNAGIPGPRNGPFHSIADLGWVLGVSAADVAALRPFVTVFNPGGKLDPYRIPQAVLSLLPSMNSETLKQALAVRRDGPGAESASRLRSILDAQSSFLEFGAPLLFRIDVQASSKRSSFQKHAQVVMFRSNEGAKPYRIADWREK